MPNGVPDKLRFENNHKFSICFENSNHPGYMTEKIVEAFAARTIPIYWGDPLVTEVFNKDAFVNVNDFASVDDMVEYVKKIDQDDMMYMKMLGTPALNEANEYLWDEKQNELKNFLYNIFDQSMESAGRRNRVFWGELYWKNFDKMRRNYVVTHNNLASKLVRKGINRMKIIIKSTNSTVQNGKHTLNRRFFQNPSRPFFSYEISNPYPEHIRNSATPIPAMNWIPPMESLEVDIRLYSLWIYNGGIDAQNTHFQTDKSQNGLHYLKFSSIYSFWAKIKRPSVLQPTVKRIYGTKKVHFFH